MFKYPFAHWDVVLWVAVLLAAFGLEMLGLKNHHDATLTALIRASIPRWVRWAFLGLLIYHFGIQ